MKEGQEEKDGRVYGCHADLNDGEEPDGCVVDNGDHEFCIYAKLPSGRPRRSKWTCAFWRVVDPGKRKEKSE